MCKREPQLRAANSADGRLPGKHSLHITRPHKHGSDLRATYLAALQSQALCLPSRSMLSAAKRSHGIQPSSGTMPGLWVRLCTPAQPAAALLRSSKM